MKYDKGDKIKVDGTIQEIENITQWDKDTQRYKFVGVSGWHEIKDCDERYLHLMEDEDMRKFVQSEQYKLSRKMMKIRYELCLDPEDMAEAINMDEYQYVELEFGDESIPVSEYKKCLNDMEEALSVLKFGDLSEFSSKDYSMGFNTDSEIENENVKNNTDEELEKMRKVEFRAWIKSLRVMADVLSIDYEDETVTLKGYKRDTIAKFSQVDLMQNTGLKDKDGVEIYEGDILNVHWFCESYDPVTLGVYWDEVNLECVEVLEVKGILGFYHENDFLPLAFVPVHEESFEVVGNVYE